MPFRSKFVLYLFVTIIFSAILVPFIKLLAFKFGAVDRPEKRRIHANVMPTGGGLVIFFSFCFAVMFLFKDILPSEWTVPVILGGLIIIITGLLDDIFKISPKQKLIGILIAALEIFFVAVIRVNRVKFPLVGTIDFGWLSLPITVIWILGITNSFNLIDGLDGLATGISLIALITMGLISLFFLKNKGLNLSILIFSLVASTIGFFPYNFYPAKIFLGDTGSLFLGFMISIFSLQGLKNATLISLMTPMFILGVPITDTFCAIIRRKFNKKPVFLADNMHLHHCLLFLGFSHRGSVIIIYILAIFFSFTALLMNYTSPIMITLLLITAIISLELFIELIGLSGLNRKPLIDVIIFLFRKVFNKSSARKYEYERKKK